MNTNNWNDFNDAEAQQGGFQLIPRKTFVTVRMSIKPGSHDDPMQGWTGGYATKSFDSGAVYLACEFVVTSGEYAKRKIWSNIGLYSAKGPKWGQMGRSFIRAVLNSARNLMPEDVSPQATVGRRIDGLADLDGIEFAALVDIERESGGEERNVIKHVIEPDHPAYVMLRGYLQNAPSTPTPGHGAVQQAAVMSQAVTQPTTQPAASGKPAWAQ